MSVSSPGSAAIATRHARSRPVDVLIEGSVRLHAAASGKTRAIVVSGPDNLHAHLRSHMSYYGRGARMDVAQCGNPNRAFVRRGRIWCSSSRAALMLLVMVLVPQLALSQSLAVTGRVSDDTGAVLPGVSVQLRTETSTRGRRRRSPMRSVDTNCKPSSQASTTFAFP